MGCPTALDPERPFKIGLPGSEVREKRTLAKRRRFRQIGAPTARGRAAAPPQACQKPKVAALFQRPPANVGQSAKLARDVAAIRGMRDHVYEASCGNSRSIHRRFATCSG